MQVQGKSTFGMITKERMLSLVKTDNMDAESTSTTARMCCSMRPRKTRGGTSILSR